MQKLNQKSLRILTIILLVLCLFFIYQWIKESKEHENHINSLSGHMIHRNFNSLISEFHYIADTLNFYHKDSSMKQDMDLFKHLLNRSDIRINEINHNLNYSINTTERFDERIIDVSLLGEIEKLLQKIMNGKVSDEKIYLIETVIRKQNEQLQNMFFGEEAIGTEGLNSKEIMLKLIGIIDNMRIEMEEIIDQ